MLEEIRIRSLGVIEESVLELGPGFTAITGETGAGKTMVVSALGLLLGGRSDATAVRRGDKSARVEGLVRLPEAASGWATHLRDAVDALGGEVEDGVLVVARQISAEGRSRAFAGGASCPAGALGRVLDPLVAGHGQSDQHRLLLPAAQREALDRFAGPEVLALRADYGEVHERLRAAESALADVVAHARERAQEADLLRFGLDEIAAVEPVAGEDDQLAAEEARLGFSDTLRAAAETARETLSADDGSPDALGALAVARRALDSVREHDPVVAELADRLAEASYLLADVAADVSSYATDVDTDPQRLAAVSERRAALTALTRKYGETLTDVLAWAEASSRRLLDLDGTDDTIEGLRTEATELRERLGDLAGRLTAARTAAATRLGEVVTEELTSLAMPHAVLGVLVRQVEDPDGLRIPGDPTRGPVRFGPHGVDEVELVLAANRGSEPRPLSKGASGGEL